MQVIVIPASLSQPVRTEDLGQDQEHDLTKLIGAHEPVKLRTPFGCTYLAVAAAVSGTPANERATAYMRTYLDSRLTRTGVAGDAVLLGTKDRLGYKSMPGQIRHQLTDAKAFLVKYRFEGDIEVYDDEARLDWYSAYQRAAGLREEPRVRQTFAVALT